MNRTYGKQNKKLYQVFPFFYSSYDLVLFTMILRNSSSSIEEPRQAEKSISAQMCYVTLSHHGSSGGVGEGNRSF